MNAHQRRVQRRALGRLFLLKGGRVACFDRAAFDAAVFYAVCASIELVRFDYKTEGEHLYCIEPPFMSESALRVGNGVWHRIAVVVPAKQGAFKVTIRNIRCYAKCTPMVKVMIGYRYESRDLFWVGQQVKANQLQTKTQFDFDEPAIVEVIAAQSWFAFEGITDIQAFARWLKAAPRHRAKLLDRILEKGLDA